MNAVVAAYVAYLLGSIALTVWVGRTLFGSGQTFLDRVFPGELAVSVNRLLLVGFYLVNAGFIALSMRTHRSLDDAQAAMELVVEKIGVVVLVLGAMHFFNLYVFSRIWRGRSSDVEAPPRAPSYPRRSSLLDVAAGVAAVPAVEGAATGRA